MTIIEAGALCAIAAIAGAVNAIAGGGTLLTFPALLWFGTPALIANATNTLALFLGTAGSIYGYRGLLAEVRPWLIRLLPASIAGGLLGGVLLTSTSERLFIQLVPYLLLFAALVFAGQQRLRRWAGFPDDAPAHPHRRVLWLANLLQFAAAVYGGYFGAGIGILMIASMGLLGVGDLARINAVKSVLVCIINCVAAAWFIHQGLIDWPRAAVMTIGAMAGYFLGAHYAQRLPQAAIRRAVIAIGLAVAAVLFWRLYAS